MTYGLQYVLKLFSSLQLLTVMSNTSDFSRKSGNLPMNIDSPKKSCEIYIFCRLTPHIFKTKVQSLSWHLYMNWVLEKGKATLGTDVKIPMMISNLNQLSLLSIKYFSKFGSGDYTNVILLIHNDKNSYPIWKMRGLKIILPFKCKDTDSVYHEYRLLRRKNTMPLVWYLHPEKNSKM